MNQTNRIHVLALRFHHFLPVIVWSLGALCALASFSYFYLLFGSFHHAYERQTVVDRLSSLRAEVGSLETEYLMLSNTVTTEMAYARGFKDVGNTLAHVEKKAITTDMAVTALR